MMGQKGPLRFALRIGEVQRVDYENMVCDIMWLQGRLPPAREVPISSAYWSKRGFLGAMPEVGAIAVCGFSAIHKDQGVRPYILSFLPNGYKTALGFDPFGAAERDAEELTTPMETVQRELDGIYGPTRHRMRKLYPGDIYGASDKGAELILDRDVRLLHTGGGEIWLRSEDQSLITTTLDAYHTTAATRRRSGRVTRSALTMPDDLAFEEGTEIFEHLVDAGILFEDGDLAPDINRLPYITLESGERLAVVTENLEDPNDPDVRAFTEDRVEIQEFSDQRMPFPDHYGFDADLIGPETQWNPFIERVSGTVVGNNPYTAEGRSNYGKLLKPVIFSDPNSTSGRPRMEALKNDAEETEKSLAAAQMYRMRRPDGLGELFLAHDKEGHVFLSIPASTSKKSNLGAGRSVEADVKGSTKLVMGANKNDRTSLDLKAKGGFKWSLGSIDRSGRSLDLTTSGGIKLKVRGPDGNGYGMQSEIQGDVGMAIEGSMGTAVSDDSIEEVGGSKSMSAEGMEVSVGMGSLNTNVLSDKSTTVKGTVTDSIGTGRSTTITKATSTGSNAEELKILSGNRQTTFGAPASDTISFGTSGTKTVESAGPLTCTWQSPTSGNFTFQASTGTYSVTMGAGSISMTGATVQMTAATSIGMKAPTIGLTGNVGLGNGAAATLPVIGGAPGPSPYIDPFTGLPLTGNPLVRTV